MSLLNMRQIDDTFSRFSTYGDYSLRQILGFAVSNAFSVRSSLIERVMNCLSVHQSLERDNVFHVLSDCDR